MSQTFAATRRVEFCDTDAAGIAHFTSMFKYMEQAEHEFLRSLDLSVVMRDDEEVISWPRVSARCDFQGAVKFEDIVEINVRIARLGTKSVTYAFEMACRGRPTAAGEMTSVCCRILEGQPPQAIAIPEPIAQKLRPFVSS